MLITNRQSNLESESNKFSHLELEKKIFSLEVVSEVISGQLVAKCRNQMSVQVVKICEQLVWEPGVATAHFQTKSKKLFFDV